MFYMCSDDQLASGTNCCKPTAFFNNTFCILSEHQIRRGTVDYLKVRTL